MSALDETWSGLTAGTADPPSNPHLRKMVLVHARNRSSHPDEAARLEALAVLRRIGGPDAMTVAVSFSNDMSLTVRRRLLQLGLEAGSDGRPILRKLAGDPDPHLAVDAIRRLTEAGDKAATTRMRGLLDARHAVVRGRAAVFLGTFGGPSLIPFLRRHLEEPDDAARSAIAWAIARLDGETDDPPPATGETWAGLALTDSAGPPAAPRTRPDADQDAEAEEVDDTAPVEESLPRVGARDDASTVEASLPDVGQAQATADVETTLPATRESSDEHGGEHEDEDAPSGSGESGRSADHSVLGIFRSLAVHPERAPELVGRLRRADDQELSEAFRARRPGQHAELSIGAAIAARELGNSRWLSPIRRLASDPEPRVRAAVAGALGALCTPSVYRNLERLAQDSDTTVQAAAVAALVHGARSLRYESQARRLIQALPDTKDEDLKAAREAAANALETE